MNRIFVDVNKCLACRRMTERVKLGVGNGRK